MLRNLPLKAILNGADSINNNLLVAYPLSENSGNKCYDSNKIDKQGATLSNCKFKTVNPFTGVYFNGNTNNKLTGFNLLNVGLSTKEISVSAWCFFDSIGQYRYLVSDYNSAASACTFTLQFTNTNKFVFFWANAGTQYPTPGAAQSSSTIVSGRWYHVVGIRRGGSGAWYSEIYVNGRRENNTTTGGNPGAGANNIVIGQPGDYINSILPMVGTLANIRVWTRALHQSEVLRLYENPTAGYVFI